MNEGKITLEKYMHGSKMLNWIKMQSFECQIVIGNQLEFSTVPNYPLFKKCIKGLLMS